MSTGGNPARVPVPRARPDREGTTRARLQKLAAITEGGGRTDLAKSTVGIMNALSVPARRHWVWVFWLCTWAWLACQPAKTPDDLDTPLPQAEQAPAGNAAATERHAAPGKSFLWRASSATAQVFLLGSIHVARQDLYPLAPPIEKAYQDSSRVVLEVHLTPEVEAETVQKSLALGVYPEGDSVDKHLSPEAWKRYSNYLETSGKPLAAFARMKPWFASLGLFMDVLGQDGFAPALGIDRYFQEKAEKDGKPIESLETVDDQLGTLANLDDKTQELMLLEFLDSKDEIAPQLEQAFFAWSAGDVEGIEKLLLSSVTRPEYERLHQKLFVERNHRMTARIRQYLTGSGTSLVIVGSGHLVGDEGILALMARDHAVEQL